MHGKFLRQLGWRLKRWNYPNWMRLTYLCLGVTEALDLPIVTVIDLPHHKETAGQLLATSRSPLLSQ